VQRWLQIAAALLLATPVVAASAQPGDQLSPRRVVAPVVRGLRPAIGDCHATEAREHPHDEPIRVDMDLTVDRDGTVVRAEAAGGGSAQLHRCLEGVFREARFPRMDEPARARVPLVFNPEP